MTFRTPAYLLSFVLFIAACGGNGGSSSEVAEMGAADQAKAVDPGNASGVVAEGAGDAAPPAGLPAPRMIVRTATLRLVVRDVPASASAFGRAAQTLGGYVASSRRWREGDHEYAHLTLRVPAARLDTALATLRRASVRVAEESVSGDDVSEEYSDLSARVRNLERAEAELLELMTTVRQRAQRAADILEVYTELTRIRGEIEGVRGRMQYLSQRTALSTVEVDLVPDAVGAVLASSPWRPLATLRRAATSLVNGLRVLADAAIWLVVFVAPVALILGAVAMVAARLYRRLRPRRRRPEAPPVS